MTDTWEEALAKRNEVRDNPYSSQGEIKGAENDLDNNAVGMGTNEQITKRKKAQNPGSADVGGAPGMGQAIHDAALEKMRRGDAAYNQNEDNYRQSISRMRADRGEVSPENEALAQREAATRNQQIGSLDIQRQAAEGGAPSAANYQTQGALDASMGVQSGGMGSARGLSALSGVQSMGGQNLGQSGANTMMAGGMGRSKEIGDAIGMYGTSAAQVRGGDMTRLAQNGSNSLGNAELNNNWKTGNAGLAAKQGQLGNEQETTRGGWYDASTVPAANQARYDQESNAMDHGKSQADAQAASAQDQATRDRNRKLVGGGITVGLTALGSMAGPLGAAAGGMGGSAINELL